MSERLSYETIRHYLEILKMETTLSHLDPILEGAMRDESPLVEVLEKLLAVEVHRRFEKRVEVNLCFSGLPMKKRLEEFDFAAQPQVPKQTIDELATLRFISSGENVILIGPCGVGKTHLAIGLALKALEQGYRVNFMTLHHLMTKVSKAHERHLIDKLLSNYLRADLLIVDEVGFLPLKAAEANFLFELVNARYQRQKAMIITSNKTFGQWEEMFPDKLLVVAILDRLLHHGHALHIRGESYRLKHRREAGLQELKQT
jgi:DNA replication protein DnaC